MNRVKMITSILVFDDPEGIHSDCILDTRAMNQGSGIPLVHSGPDALKKGIALSENR
ncbi:MAG: hypothetical protein NTX88_10120 [Candidatus Atribacteria bacterium]|nr:hypothetical protein [Candidatus Atribacteria bacterium]